MNFNQISSENSKKESDQTINSPTQSDQLVSPQNSQYDLWSDQELEQLNQLIQSNLDQTHPQNQIILPTFQSNVFNSITHTTSTSLPDRQSSLPPIQKSNPSPTNPIKLNPTKSRSHPSLNFSLISPSRPPQTRSFSNQLVHSPKLKNQRKVSSLFTTGANLQIPLDLDDDFEIINSKQDEKTSSEAHQTNDSKNLSEISTTTDQPIPSNSSPPPAPSTNSILGPQALPISHSSQSPPSSLSPFSIHPPKRALSSIFQTGAGRPYPLDNGLVERDGFNPVEGNESYPAFGFQTGRGSLVSAPSEQSIQKALELCTTNLTTPFPKRPYKEPDSPSPSHRAKIHKSSPFEQFEQTLSPRGDRSTIQETSNGKSAQTEGSNAAQPFAGLLSTGAGIPVNISSSAIERSRAHLDESSRLSEREPTSRNDFQSPLKEISNLQSNSSHYNSISMKAELLVGSHQSVRPISTTQMESLNTVTSKIPSQPTTAASLMSTPTRPIPHMFSSSSLDKLPTDELTSINPTVSHVVTAPVRRISNRMHIGLTPQSSRRVSHEGKPSTESRPFVTPFKKNIQGFHLNSKSAVPSMNSLSTPARDSTAQVYRQDETPLLNQTKRRVMYMEPTPSFERSQMGHKPQSVYNLQVRMEQRKIPMKVWLGPHKEYTARNLLSLAIPESVVFMTSKSSLVWTFNPLTDPFGSIHALDQLLKSGCPISRTSPTWVVNHWGLIVWKLSSLVRWRPDCFHRVWNPSYVVEQLKYRYEREFIHGHRSIIMRILDRDCPPNIPMCLVIVGIIRKGNQASSSSQQQLIELSDGWYKIQGVLDAVLTRTLKRGALKVGFKMAIFGASTEMISKSKPLNLNHKVDQRKNRGLVPRDSKNQEAKSIKNQAKEEEQEEEEETRLYLEGNSTSRVKFDENLGFRSSRKPWFASLKSITFDGGKIPLMDLVIMKVSEPSFLDDGDRRIAYQSWNLEIETKLRIAWENEREKEMNNIVNEERIKFERVEKILNKILNVIYGIKYSSSPTRKIKANHRKNEEPNQTEKNQIGIHNHNYDDGCDKLIGEGIELEAGSIHSESSASPFDADEMCEELIEEDQEGIQSNEEDSQKNLKIIDDQSGFWHSKINQISLGKLMKLRTAFESKLESLKNSSVDSIQKKLDMVVPIRKTRKIQTLQVEDFHNSIYCTNRSNNDNKFHPRKKRTAQLIVHDLSQLPDGFFQTRKSLLGSKPSPSTSSSLGLKIKSFSNSINYSQRLSLDSC